jgi:hypothetical protein
MIAALIAAASLIALFPLFVSYCGTVLAAAKSVELSERAAAMAETDGRGISADDFDRILQLVRLCPEYDVDRSRVRAITIYYGLIQALSRRLGGFSPSLAWWVEREGAHCSHFAAVVLDRSICSSRSLFTDQVGDRL